MKKNIGTTDTVIRVIIAILIAVFYLSGMISGTAAIILGIIALILLVTGLAGWCGLYTIFGINTCSCKKKEDGPGA